MDVRGHHKYYSSGVFYIPDGNFNINIFILNTDGSTNKAEARIFNVTDTVRTSLNVAPLGLVEIISGRVKTFTAAVAKKGLYEVEVYLEDSDKMNVVSHVVNKENEEVEESTRVLNNQYQKIDCFLG